jgi:hypothetical protein
VEDTPSQLKLVGINEATEVISKDQIATRENSTNSLMPEGFGNLPDEMFRNLAWYLLAPPEEGPLTPAKKAAISQPVTEETAPAKSEPNHDKIDWEGVKMWNPAWAITAPEFEGTPRKHKEYAGKPNVLELHPFPGEKSRPATLVRQLLVPAGKPTLDFSVASHEKGDWKLQVSIDGTPVHTQPIDHATPLWKTVSIPLEKWAGKTITIELASLATDWNFEFSYWSDLRLGGQ